MRHFDAMSYAPSLRKYYATETEVTRYLALDSSAAETQLGWRPRWELEQALESIVEWHRALAGGRDVRSLCLEQIERFALA